jgi:hypothetical protein
MPVDIPVREVRKWPISAVSVKFCQAAAEKTPRDAMSAEIHAPYKLFEPTTMDKVRFSGTMRTNYRSGLTITSPFCPPIPAKPDNCLRAQYDLESIHFRTSEKVQLARVVGVFHCNNINEILD